MRIIQDENLDLWEAYATSGGFGFPDHSRMVFHCLSDRTRRARAVEREGDKAEVEHEIATLTNEQLTALLSETVELK